MWPAHLHARVGGRQHNFDPPEDFEVAVAATWPAEHALVALPCVSHGRGDGTGEVSQSSNAVWRPDKARGATLPVLEHAAIKRSWERNAKANDNLQT